jgi:VanZ family protein
VGEGPDWIREAIAQAIAEAHRYLATVAGFTMHPAKFARDWSDQRIKALNPLGMLATSAGLAATAAQILVHTVHRSGAELSLWHSLGDAAAPFLHYLFLGLVCHLLLAARRPLRDSLGIALFAGAGPAVWTELLSYAISLGLWFVGGRPLVGKKALMGALPQSFSYVTAAFAICGLLAFIVTFAIAMAAMHQVSVARMALSLLISVAIAGAIFALLPLEWAFGPRLTLRLHPLHVDLWID